MKYNKNFNDTDFPESIQNNLMNEKLLHNYYLTEKGRDYITLDKNIYNKRKAIWNDYAEKNNFFPIGTIFESRKNCYESDILMIVDILPKNEKYYTTNSYVCIYLSSFNIPLDKPKREIVQLVNESLYDHQHAVYYPIDACEYDNIYGLHYKNNNSTFTYVIGIIDYDLDNYIQNSIKNFKLIKQQLINKEILGFIEISTPFWRTFPRACIQTIKKVYGSFGSTRYSLIAKDDVSVDCTHDTTSKPADDWEVKKAIKETWYEYKCDIYADGEINYYAEYIDVMENGHGYVFDLKKSNITKNDIISYLSRRKSNNNLPDVLYNKLNFILKIEGFPCIIDHEFYELRRRTHFLYYL